MIDANTLVFIPHNATQGKTVHVVRNLRLYVLSSYVSIEFWEGRHLKIAVALSGGVDSVVAMYTLIQQGHTVSAFHIKTMPDEFYARKKATHKTHCSPSDTRDARLIAHQLGVLFEVIDVEDMFREKIIDYYTSEYIKGRTPNPCYFCNRYVKFGILLEKVIHRGFDRLASGHYARIVDGKLYKAIDKEKDQSYFLSSIEREKLRYLVFPNGDKTKRQVREIAEMAKLHIHEKRESQDLCFIPDGDQNTFFSERGLTSNPGLIVDTRGNTLGKHRGLFNYTVGQRKLRISAKERLYVVRLDSEKNTVVVGKKEEVYTDTFRVSNLNLLCEVPAEFSASVMVRKKAEEVPCRVKMNDDTATITCERPIFAVTPGQIAVLYNHDLVIASGVID